MITLVRSGFGPAPIPSCTGALVYGQMQVEAFGNVWTIFSENCDFFHFFDELKGDTDDYRPSHVLRTFVLVRD